MKKTTAFLVGGAAALSLTALTACSDKAMEQFNDAEISGSNDGSAEVINFPDGFSNVATKCDNGNRVYVLFKGDAAYGGIAVVPNDASCGAGSQ